MIDGIGMVGTPFFVHTPGMLAVLHSAVMMSLSDPVGSPSASQGALLAALMSWVFTSSGSGESWMPLMIASLAALQASPTGPVGSFGRSASATSRLTDRLV